MCRCLGGSVQLGDTFSMPPDTAALRGYFLSLCPGAPGSDVANDFLGSLHLSWEESGELGSDSFILNKP